MSAEGAAVAKGRIHVDSLLDESDGAFAAFLAGNIAFAAVDAFVLITVDAQQRKIAHGLEKNRNRTQILAERTIIFE